MIITERLPRPAAFPSSPAWPCAAHRISIPRPSRRAPACAVALLRMRSLVDGIKEAPHPEERSPFDKMAGGSRRTHRAVPPGWPTGLAAEGEKRCACSQRCRRKICAWCRRRRARPRLRSASVRVGAGHRAAVVSLVFDRPEPPPSYKARLVGIPGLNHVTVEVQPCLGEH
jgi:hypothetical protein